MGVLYIVVSFDIAEQVEVTLNRNKDNATVVHLTNLSGARSDNFGKHFPIPAGSMGVGGARGNIGARALVSETQLNVKDGMILMPGIDQFEVVVIEGFD
jgi:hypothetical protein